MMPFSAQNLISLTSSTEDTPTRSVSRHVQEDLDHTDQLALNVLESLLAEAPKEIHSQLKDNIAWIRSAKENNLVVGSKARILYADAEGRMILADALHFAKRYKPELVLDFATLTGAAAAAVGPYGIVLLHI